VGERRGAYRILGGRQLGRLRHTWEDNFKMGFKKLDGEAWIEFI
jgi:hypothetical protein